MEYSFYVLAKHLNPFEVEFVAAKDAPVYPFSTELRHARTYATTAQAERYNPFAHLGFSPTKVVATI